MNYKDRLHLTTSSKEGMENDPADRPSRETLEDEEALPTRRRIEIPVENHKAVVDDLVLLVEGVAAIVYVYHLLVSVLVNHH